MRQNSKEKFNNWVTRGLTNSIVASSCGLVAVVRGYHVYQRIWTPFVGEKANTTLEVTNVHDRYAIAVLEDDTLCTVGHLPREMSQECFYFIRRGGTISVEVTGPRQKSATEGKGMEIPCVLTFRQDDDDAILRKAKELILKKGFKEKTDMIEAAGPPLAKKRKNKRQQ